MQSGVAGTSHAPTTTVPIECTVVLAVPTVVNNAPSCEEMKGAFAEVSSALHSVSSQHDVVRVEMQALSCGMKQMRMERARELETTAQVKVMLQRTLSASRSLEMRLG